MVTAKPSVSLRYTYRTASAGSARKDLALTSACGLAIGTEAQAAAVRAMTGRNLINPGKRTAASHRIKVASLQAFCLRA